VVRRPYPMICITNESECIEVCIARNFNAHGHMSRNLSSCSSRSKVNLQGHWIIRVYGAVNRSILSKALALRREPSRAKQQ